MNLIKKLFKYFFLFFAVLYALIGFLALTKHDTEIALKAIVFSIIGFIFYFILLIKLKRDENKKLGK